MSTFKNDTITGKAKDAQESLADLTSAIMEHIASCEDDRELKYWRFRLVCIQDAYRLLDALTTSP